MKKLPLLHSQEKEYKNKIKELEGQLEAVYYSAIRHCIGCVNRSELDKDDKTYLIEKFLEK